MLSRARSKLEADPATCVAGGAGLAGRPKRFPSRNAEFDHLTFTYLLRYVDDPDATMRELARVVRPGGRVACLEFSVPRPPFLAPWRAYTRVGLPLLGRLVSRETGSGLGSFLGPSIEGLYERYPVERQLESWDRAGIGDVRYRTMSLGAGIVIWGTRRGS